MTRAQLLAVLPQKLRTTIWSQRETSLVSMRRLVSEVWCTCTYGGIRGDGPRQEAGNVSNTTEIVTCKATSSIRNAATYRLWSMHQ